MNLIARNVIAVESGFNIFGSCSEQHARFSINYVPLWYLVKKYFLQILTRLSRMINVNVKIKKNFYGKPDGVLILPNKGIRVSLKMYYSKGEVLTIWWFVNVYGDLRRTNCHRKGLQLNRADNSRFYGKSVNAPPAKTVDHMGQETDVIRPVV